ncbi:cysteine-rich venom protein 6-like [Sarcoptes scabiei]|nr:cysteine-rich venom protein 6-like [Sarcoptes scabiei]
MWKQTPKASSNNQLGPLHSNQSSLTIQKNLSGSNLFGSSRIPTSIKQPNRNTLLNSVGFNSTGKPNIFGFNSTAKKKSSLFHQSNVPSTIQSTGHLSNYGGSVQKNASKLFGMTPQSNRASFSQNGMASASRLSRSSITNRQVKENRVLSDPNYHRECQEKIVEFLTTNGYPNPITRQNLVRLSLSDASRIFQFLFSFFSEDIVIKNGPDTSLECVVTKMMPLFRYPYPIKKSDLVSFSGGRQLGSVLSMMDFLIDYINYTINCDISRIIGRDFLTMMDDENDVDMNKVMPRLHDLACRPDWEENKLQNFTELSEEFYGSEKEAEECKETVENLEKTLAKIDEDLAFFTELPKKKQDLINDIGNCEQYIEEMIEHNKANLIIKNALDEEIRLIKESLQKLTQEKEKLEKQYDEQKDVRIEYQYAIKHRKQIQEELEQVELHNKLSKETISTLNLEINKEKSSLQSVLNDFEEMNNIVFNMFKESKIKKFLPNSTVSFEKDPEWKQFFDKFSLINSQNLDHLKEETFRELKELSSRKFREFKMILIEMATKLKTSVTLEIVCKNQERTKHRDQLKQEEKDSENRLQNLWTEKNETEISQQKELKQLDEQLEMLKQQIVNDKKLLDGRDLSSKQLENQIKQKNEEIVAKKLAIMNDFKNLSIKHKNFEDKLVNYLNECCNKLRKQNEILDQTLSKIGKSLLSTFRSNFRNAFLIDDMILIHT